MGRKDWPGSQRGCQTGNARKTCEAAARNGLLFAPPDQRASSFEREDFAETWPPSLWRYPRKRGPPPQCRRHDADLSEQGPQSAAVVPGGIQSEYAKPFAAPFARTPEAPRRKSCHPLVSSELDLISRSGFLHTIFSLQGL